MARHAGILRSGMMALAFALVLTTAGAAGAKGKDAKGKDAKMDPAMAMTYEGPSAGVGAASSWVSDKAGTGKMTVTKSEAPPTR